MAKGLCWSLLTITKDMELRKFLYEGGCKLPFNSIKLSSILAMYHRKAHLEATNHLLGPARRKA